MKKITIFAIFVIFSLFTIISAFAETEFTRALSTCSPYTLNGSIPYQGQIFNLKISLQKGKGDKCTYKERIYQDIGYEELVCNFSNEQLKSITASMIEYSDTFKKELLKNKIFEAKLSSNAVVFQNYLVEPHICKINYSKKK